MHIKLFINSCAQIYAEQCLSGPCRKLNDTAFTALSPNGEKVTRNWLIYSPSTGCLFCFVCKLFSSASGNSSSLATTGFDSWDHIGRLNDHERSLQHRESLSKYAIRLAKHETIDRCIVDSYARENSYWGRFWEEYSFGSYVSCHSWTSSLWKQ